MNMKFENGSEISLNHAAKPNKKLIRGICSFCKESSNFRVVLAPYGGGTNKQNLLACVRCLSSVPYSKKMPVIQHRIFLKRPVTKLEKLQIRLRKIKEYFLGNRIRRSFGRKRLV